MDSLLRHSNRILKNTSTKFKRYLHEQIEYDARLIIIKGCRGVGKTTLLNQHIIDQRDVHKSIHLSLDHLYFTDHKLLYTVESLYALGYRNYVIDEVHKYENWSVEVKNIYDSFRDIKMLITASSALNIDSASGDLSRRADRYNLIGLSFREYLNFELGLQLPRLTLQDLINKSATVESALRNEIAIEKYFKRYLSKGYFPFYKEAGRRYHDRIANIINQVIEVDLPPIFSIDYNTVRQVKRLLSLISRMAPFTPNISKLSRDLGIPRNSLLVYIDYLDSAGLINILKSNKKSDSALTKPDKIYLENTNISYALSIDAVNTGTLRETFMRNALSVHHHCTTPIAGDLMVDDQYVFEIGGPNKNFHQIADMPNAYLVKDIFTSGGQGVIPMWLFGFLY